jgi:hypothetical protein
MVVSFDATSPDALHADFLVLLPKLQNHAEIYFRHVNCPNQKADKIAETIALAWKWFLRLHERGKDINQFTMVFVYLVAKAVKSGRRLTGTEKAKDVMSPLAQRRHGFKVEAMSAAMKTTFESLYSTPRGQDLLDAFEEHLADNTVTPVPDQAAFRIDFANWLGTLTGRERRLIGAMAQNERTKDLSKKFELSSGRISQFRREFETGWKRFCGDEAVA